MCYKLWLYTGTAGFIKKNEFGLLGLVLLGIVVLLAFALVCVVIACTKEIKKEVEKDDRTEQSRR